MEVHKKGNYILLVDDDEDLVKLYKMGLNRYGFKICEFVDSIEALNAFTSHPDIYQLVITDIRMPGMDGIEFARRIRTINKKIRIIFVS